MTDEKQTNENPDPEVIPPETDKAPADDKFIEFTKKATASTERVVSQLDLEAPNPSTGRMQRHPPALHEETMTFEEMAWEFAEVFDELDIEQINEMLAKNIPLETLDFFSKYTSE